MAFGFGRRRGGAGNAGAGNNMGSRTGAASLGMLQRAILYLSLLLLLAGWIIMLVGVSMLQYNCNNGGQYFTSFANAGYFAPQNCSSFYRWAWWLTWYQFALIVLGAFLLVSGLVHIFRAGLIGLFAALLALLMLNTNTFLYAIDQTTGRNSGASGSLKRRLQTYFAGVIICAFADALMIIALGIYDEIANVGVANEPYGGMGKRNMGNNGVGNNGVGPNTGTGYTGTGYGTNAAPATATTV